MNTNLSIDFIVSIAEDLFRDVLTVAMNTPKEQLSAVDAVKHFAERLQEKLEAADADKAIRQSE